MPWGFLSFSNVESLTVAFLNSRSELAGVPVGVRLPPGHDGAARAVVVSRVGGEFQPDDLIDRALVRIDTYGPDRVAALDLAGTVRSLVWLMPDLAHAGGVKVLDVDEERGPSLMRDPVIPTANRYTTRYRLHLSVHPRAE